MFSVNLKKNRGSLQALKFLAFFVSLASHIFACAAPLNVTVLGNTPFILDTSQPQNKIVVNILLSEKIDLKTTSVALQSVRRDKQVIVSSGIFKVDENLIDSDRPAPSIAISTDKTSQIPSGTYELTILLQDVSKNILTTFIIPLSRPWTQLISPSKQTIDIDSKFSLFNDVQDFNPKFLRLELDKISSVQDLGNLTITNGTFSWNDRSIAASITTPKFKYIDSLSSINIDIHPSIFPVGKTNGQVKISGDHIQTPLSIDLEIIVRRDPIWIIFMVGFGILIGWLIRVILQHKIDINKMRASALNILSASQSQSKEVFDNDYQLSYDTAAGRLKAALRTTEVQEIQDAIDLFKKSIESMTSKLNDTLVSLEKEVSDLQSLPDWGMLPPRIKFSCDTLNDSLKIISSFMLRNDATSAKSHLKEARQKFLQALQEGTVSSESDIKKSNDMYADLETLFDPDQKGKRANLFDSLRTIPDGLVLSSSNPDAQTIIDLLDKWRSLGLRRVNELIDFIQCAIDDTNEIARLATEVVDSDETKAAILNIHDVMKKFTSTAISSNIWNASDINIKEINHAYNQLGSTIQSRLNSGISEKFRSDWKNNGLFVALRNVNPSSASFSVSLSSLGLALPSVSRGRTIPAYLATLNAHFNKIAMGSKPQKESVQNRRVSLKAVANIDAFRTRTIRRIFMATAVQSICIGCVLIWISYVSYYLHFIGTPGELLSLFLWGFSVDLSVAGLVSTAASLKRP